MNVGDVIGFETRGSYVGQAWIITWFYRVTNLLLFPDGTPFNQVAEQWVATQFQAIWDVMEQLTANTCTLTQVRAYNLFNVGEVGTYIFPTPEVGTNANPSNSPEIAYGFKQPQGRRGMNPGFKRWPGVCNNVVLDEGVISGSGLTVMSTAAVLMRENTNLVAPGDEWDIVIIPVIVKRVRTGGGTPSNPYEYRLPETQAEMGVNYYLAQGWAPIPYTTTQNSRKRGRGI